ncbi:asparaginase [Homoserinibacter sp. YIM 151385]|uniref:asparaginase n=1 Tax=Homoserinibacter sp. YIM 151385 TaxID=2985506 RepID=UPI0022F03012|nr:asparaginase [Homoserinibacter sp. YIM 151385]WBU38319.1 asparaginase [Homoserinibacter sp. YIM 151385]
MSHPLHLDGVVELAVLERSGLVESRHLGAAVLLDGDGSVLRAHGDTGALVYTRSTLKPQQALAALATGLQLEGEQLVLAAASHGGTERHVAVVEGMLAASGLTEADLGCALDYPLDGAARRAATEPRRITQNCSGKHAAFLGACVHVGWPTAGYLSPEHPLQRVIVSTVEALSGERVEHSGIDGCGAPVHALTLRGLARGTSRALTSDAPLAAAIRRDPWALDGEGRANTVAIERTGLIAKGGHEGVLVMSASDGTTLALKMLDGSARATTLVGLEILAQEGIVSRDAADEVLELTLERVLGGGEPVGALRPAI